MYMCRDAAIAALADNKLKLKPDAGASAEQAVHLPGPASFFNVVPAVTFVS